MAGFVVQRPQQQGYREGEGLGAVQSFTVSVSGEYAVELLGASGGNSTADPLTDGGLGAEVSGDVFLTEERISLCSSRGGAKPRSPPAAAAVSSSMGRMFLPSPGAAAARAPAMSAVLDWLERAAEQEQGPLVGKAAWVGPAAAAAWAAAARA
jgi:Glycine rich protein